MDTPIRERTTTALSDAAGGHDALLREAARQLGVMRRVFKLVVRQLTTDTSPEAAQLGEGQYHALHALHEHGRLKAGELADRCHVTEPTVSKMLKSLEHNQLVERHTDPDNRRVVWVSLTDAGRALHDELIAHFESGVARVLEPLTDAQLHDLINAFGHLQRLVERADRDEHRRSGKSSAASHDHRGNAS